MDRERVVTALFGTPGEAVWSQQLGGTNDDQGTAIASDSDGNLIIVGNFNDSFTIGTTTIATNGGYDFFVAKLSAADGSIAWVKSFGGAGANTAGSVALDASNNIYIAGSFDGTMSFGATSLQSAGSTDGFALKLDSDGAFVWAKAIGGTSGDGSNNVAVHGSTVAVVGSFQGTMTINGTTVMTPGTSQGYLVEFGADGSAGMVKTFPGTGNSSPSAVTFDSTGNIVLCGSLSGTATFGGGAMTSNSGDAFVAKYTGSGAFLFAKVLGGTGFDSCSAVSIGPLDDVFVIGTFFGTVSFGGASPLNANSGNLVIAKYSPAGAYNWAQAFGGTTAQVASYSASVNASGDIVASGGFCGNFMFGTKLLSSVGTCASSDYDMFAARLSGVDGTPITAMRAGGSKQETANGVVQAADGRHFIVGSFKGFADFGGTSRTSAGENDAVVIGLAPL